jgi:probable rRNA maturation factor
MELAITATVKTYPRHQYAAMADKILGKRYNLSLVFIGSARAATLNKLYRKKTYSPNVLSFPLNEHTGEIFICPQVAGREATKFDLTPAGYVGFLFIHGCLHLKGLDHGDTMEAQEAKWVKHFKLV